jgi:predicted metalloprotease
LQIAGVPGGDALADGAAPPSSSVDPNGYAYTVEEYLAWAIKDLDAKWTPWFTSRGYAEPQVRYDVILPGETFRSVCTNIPVLTDTTPNAYYCPGDANGEGQIWLPVTTLQKMWSGDVFTRRSQRIGDFAAAIITAHEFGHHVADELQGQSTKAGRTITALTGANPELLADCFAGVWAATAYYGGVLEPGDFEEAVAALEAIGDPATSTTTPVVAPHGTAEQRVAALQLGYNQQANPTPCVQTYWK